MKTAKSLAAVLALSLLMPAAASAQTFSNEEMSCVQYGNWIVGQFRQAESRGCSFAGTVMWYDPMQHARWCMGQSEAKMRNHAVGVRNSIAQRCSAQGVDVSGRAPAPAASNLPSFSNEEQSCALYGNWAVGLMRRADAMGCDFDNSRDWFTPQRHLNWCMGQSAAVMRNQAQTHWNNMVSRCARRGVTFTGR